MPRKKITLKYRKERSILSDVLPYEIPVTFSNRHFYDFLLCNNVEFQDGKVSWRADDDILDAIIRLMFGISDNAVIDEKKIKAFDQQVTIKSCIIDTVSIPFCYKISHKFKEYRELAVPHPRNQIQIADFYHSCKELILYYCSVSPFSIRQPKKISKHIFHKDRTHYDNLSQDVSNIEEYSKEYENLRSFFVYKDYSNIYKFYESYKYHRCEKKYNKLLKLDISKCFDSIYTHSLSWALLNKESVKESITASNKTFAGRFDKLMQQINYNETNGIIIGPEFSRIFAELILQSVDKAVQKRLLNKHTLRHKVDYEIFRYVDDYFIFFNDESAKDSVLEVLQLALKEYKLYLNSTKAITYEKPIITEISRAKHRIAQLLDEKLVYKLEDLDVSEGDQKPAQKGSIYLNSKSLITQFKTIIRECDVEYKDMLNYSLSIVDSQCDKIIKNYHRAAKEYRSEKQLVQAILGILEFVFFIYSVSPRVNTTIKLCRILRIFSTYLQANDSNKDFKHLVFKYIYDDVCFILKKNRNDEHTQVETLYLLIALSEMGRDYWLEESALAEYFNIKVDGGNFISCPNLNYFSITVIIFYMSEKKRYGKLRTFIESEIIKKFEDKKRTLAKEAELTMLFFDTVSCPYISNNTKVSLLEIYRVPSQLHHGIINRKHKHNSFRNQLWFTTWEDFNFGKALDAKQSQEVY